MAYNDDDAQRELADNLYNANKDMNSDLYKALLAQSMKAGNYSSQMSTIGHLVAAYMGMQGNPAMQGSMAYNKMLGQSINNDALSGMSFPLTSP